MSTDQLGPGVYFGLHEDAYHRDPALGSSAIKLLKEPVDYQWDRLFPQQRPSKALDYGTLVHLLVLYGQEEFDRRVALRPARWDSYRSPDARLWRDQRLHEGKIVVENTRMLDEVHAARNEIFRLPKIREAFQDGRAEVSIFWDEKPFPHLPPVRCKARIDYLKIRSMTDLKTFQPRARNIRMETACKQAIVRERYDVQAVHYLRGRSTFVDHFKAGRIYNMGKPSEQPSEEWLMKVADYREPAWAWVFFKKTMAPAATAFTYECRAEREITARERDEALRQYAEHRDRDGLTKPWKYRSEILPFLDEDVPTWIGE